MLMHDTHFIIGLNIPLYHTNIIIYNANYSVIHKYFQIDCCNYQNSIFNRVWFNGLRSVAQQELSCAY